MASPPPSSEAPSSETIEIKSIEDLRAAIGSCAGREITIVICGLTKFQDAAKISRMLYEKRREMGWTVEDADLKVLDDATDRCLSLMALGRSFSSVMFQMESGKLLELHVLAKLRRELSKASGLWELVGVDDAMAIAMEGQSILRELGLSDEKPLDSDNDDGSEEATDDYDSPSEEADDDCDSPSEEVIEDNNVQDEPASVSRALTSSEAVLMKNRISSLKDLIQKMIDGPIRFPQNVRKQSS